MIKVIDEEKIDVVCPNCNQRIKTVWVCERISVAGVCYIYFCTNCQKLLGTSRRKGFMNITSKTKFAGKAID